MTKLIDISNPDIVITVPDDRIKEVGGHCWQIGGSQPLTFAKHLWRVEKEQEPQGLDEAANEYAWGKQEPHIDFDGDEYLDYGSRYDAFKAGAKWQSQHSLTREDIERLDALIYAIKNNKTGAFTFSKMSDEKYEEVLKRFNEQKK